MTKIDIFVILTYFNQLLKCKPFHVFSTYSIHARVGDPNAF